MDDLASKLTGRFIVIDGGDGAGKSTQMKLLADHLRQAGVDLVQTRDPGGTPIGDKIRHILLDNSHHEMAVQCELMLYMASRAQLAQQVIRPALAAGGCVLCDRYISATVAYQGAAGANLDDIAAAADIAVGNCRPDLTIILDIPADAGLARVARSLDRMEAKDLAFHRRVRELFLQQAQDRPEHFAVVDAARPAEQVQGDIVSAIAAFGAKGRR